MVPLPDTPFIPDLRCNLIWVARVTDQGFSVTFNGNVASVNDSYGNTKRVANRKSNLYYVEEHCGLMPVIIEKNVDV